MTKRNKIILAVVVLVLLVLLWRSAAGKSLMAKITGGSGYPTSERASQHFAWDELLTASPKVGDTYETLNQNEIDQFATVAELLEYIRRLNGDLPIVCTFINVPAADDAGNGTGDYSVALRADAIEKTAGLLKAAQDAQSNLAGYGGSIYTVAQSGNGIRLGGSMATLTAARDAGALQV